ncbi:MAG: hypothetical protein AABZ60_16485 [Planctomycetota bacterium]
MKLEILALCDAATDSQGKLNLLGAFDHIWSRKIPMIHPFCAIALRIRLSKTEQGKHRIRINFIDADGKIVIPTLDGTLNIKCPADENSIAANLILQVQHLKLERFGEYSIDITVDGEHQGSLPLFVKQLQTPSTDEVKE